MTRPRRSFLLLALVVSGGCSEPAAAPTSAPAARPVAPAVAAPEPAPLELPGRLIFLAETEGNAALVGQRGQDRRELLRGTGLYPAAVDPGGTMLAVIAVDEQNGEHREHLEIRPLGDETLGPPIYSSETSTHVRNPSWGPGGRFFVFEAAFTSFRDLYRVELPAGTLTRLTDNTEGNFEPAVSPDGRNIAFVSSRDGNAEVYRMTAEGGEPTRLTEFPLDDWGPMWAPDGQTLVFLSNRELIDRIFLMRPDGGEQRRLTADRTPARDPDAPLGDEPHETDPAIAPDGASIAYCVRTGSQGAALRIAPMTAGGPVINLSDGSVSDRSPVWSPDGAHLVFVSNRDAGDLELYGIPRAGGEPSRLTRREGADWLPRWAPR
jgi:TolB protein